MADDVENKNVKTKNWPIILFDRTWKFHSSYRPD